ncbi:MAG TPA: NAD(P)/FAD-dependent oxidoreductase [Bacilli bacterium]|nr:NAD(P)/FAD-dependent oxidoreductase [Bacilli bacterium]
MYDITIIGAGVIGALISYELAKYDVRVLILDRENDVCNATSAANSAIIHAGYDPVPGSLKAQLNVESVPLFKELCENLDVEFKRIGSLLVARSEEDHAALLELEERAKINGVTVKILDKESTLALEPNLTDTTHSALFAPTAGIINPFELTSHAVENAIMHGTRLELNNEVKQIKKVDDYFVITTNVAEYKSKIVINAAGIYADEITNMVSKAEYKITPRKGSYFVIDKLSKPLVNHVIFPLPSARSKGILIVPTTSGNYLVGPTSEQIMSREDIGTDEETLNYIKGHANSLVPSIPFHKTIRTFSGLRATSTTGDFVISHDPHVKGLINVGGIESPGLASAPGIALYVLNLVRDLKTLKPRENYNPRIKKRVRTVNLTQAELKALAKQDPNYGEIVCNCEHITKAEILDLLSRPIPIKSIKAIKKRLRTGFGMCQGGFCVPKVMKIVADYYNVPLRDVLYDEIESNIIIDE